MTVDRLGEVGTPSGLVIVNRGDPTLPQLSNGSSGAEAFFLRLVAYLAFAETVAVPARHALESEPVARALRWARPLLADGCVIIERRAGVASYSELARVRRLSEACVRRGHELDRAEAGFRSFKYADLSAHYKALLDTDLARGGALGAILGARRAAGHRPLLDAAHDWHLEHGDGTPEQFVRAIELQDPKLAVQARRWAMARYYVTPADFDDVNTREVPDTAHKLLIKGGVWPEQLESYEDAAPADELRSRLRVTLLRHPVAQWHRQYCESLLEVRRAFPEARRLFSDIRERSQLEDAGASLSDRLAIEMARQLAVRAPTGRTFDLVSGLVGASATLPIVPSGAVGLASALAAGAATSVTTGMIRGHMDEKRDRRGAPWRLAIESYEDKAARKLARP